MKKLKQLPANNEDLDRILKRAKLPQISAQYTKNFPSTVIRRLRLEKVSGSKKMGNS